MAAKEQKGLYVFATVNYHCGERGCESTDFGTVKALYSHMTVQHGLGAEEAHKAIEQLRDASLSCYDWS
jgi:hypothetical protein